MGLGGGELASIADTILSFQKREDSTVTATIDMAQLDNLILISPNLDGEDTAIVDTAETNTFGSEANVVDGNLETLSGTPDFQSETERAFFDFGSIASREIFWSGGLGQLTGASNTVQFEVFTSDNKSVWNSKDTISRSFSGADAISYPSDFYHRTITSHSFRYVKFEATRTSGTGQMKAQLSELATTGVFDVASNNLGSPPESNYSLEVKDDLTGDWRTLSNFITTDRGIGKLASRSGNPDLSTHFRAKLVTTHGMKNGLFVIKI